MAHRALRGGRCMGITTLTDLFQRPPYRDPLNPGGPLLPRSSWSRAPMHRWTFQHIREMTPTAQVWRGAGPGHADAREFAGARYGCFQL